MKMNANIWWSHPGSKYFLGEFVSHLHQGKNIVASFPQFAPEGLYDAVREKTRKDWGTPVRIQIDQEKEVGSHPELLVFKAFSVPETNYSLRENSVESLVTCQKTRGRIAWIDNMNTESWLSWKNFLVKYAEACRLRTDPTFSPLKFIIPIHGELTGQTPRTDVYLTNAKYRGYVTRLDMQIYVSAIMDTIEIFHRAKPRVRHLATAVVSEIAGPDPFLASLLLEMPLETIFAPKQVLIDFAQRRGWTHDQSGSTSSEKAWQQGILNEFNEERHVHSAFLAIAKEPTDYNRRLWKAQVGVLLPEIEEYRSKMLERLPPGTNRYTQHGNLKELSRLRWDLQGRISMNDLNVLDAHYIVRNELAHLRPATLEMLQAIGY